MKSKSIKKRGTGWSDIPPELLELILQRLGIFDYLKCAQVCRSWQNAVDDAKRNARCAPAPRFPFLFSLPPSGNNSLATFLDLARTDAVLYNIPTQPSFIDYKCVSSVEGWLVLQKPYYEKSRLYFSLRFLNPVSRQQYEFPLLPMFLVSDHKIVPNDPIDVIFPQIAVSSLPSDHGAPRFLVAIYATFRLLFEKQLYFFNGSSWTSLETPEHFAGIIIVDWKLYAIPHRDPNVLVVFNLRDKDPCAKRLVMLQYPNLEERSSRSFRCEDGHYYHCNTYKLAKDSTRGEVFAVACSHVLLNNHKKKEFSLSAKGFRLFKLDLSGLRWIEIDSLGERFLLMDSAKVEVISTKDVDLPGPFPKELIGGNCVCFCGTNTFIYYPHREMPDCGVFFLKDKTMQHFPLSPNSQITTQCTWFTPSVW